MKLIKYPKESSWPRLCQRPAIDSRQLDKVVGKILYDVKLKGDTALKDYARKFDRIKLGSVLIGNTKLKSSGKKVPAKLKSAIRLAKKNIEKFHRSQAKNENAIQIASGISCWRKSVAIERVGLYIPGGSAPLFSTVLMLGIPAKIAGCKEIVLCTPPGKNGQIDPAILFTANLLGIEKVFSVGGAQAIAAMAYGTKSIPKVDKIFGPGNQYVTCAKQLVQRDGVAIDMPAGPSEVLVIADASCEPEFVAADLLSQAEHGKDSQVILLSDSLTIIRKVEDELKKQLKKLTRKSIAKEALKNSKFILMKNLKQAIGFSNEYAPEHLILACKNAESFAQRIVNAGSVFIGNYSPESAGDYASGTNHTLPTGGFAKSYSGVSTDSFVKKITFQKLNRSGLQRIGPAVEQMAEAEGLQAHKNAITVRLK